MISNLCCIVKVSVDSYNDLNMNGFQSSFRVALKLKSTNHRLYFLININEKFKNGVYIHSTKCGRETEKNG